MHKIDILFLEVLSKVQRSFFEGGCVEPNPLLRLWLKLVQINKIQLLIHKAEYCLCLVKVPSPPNQDHCEVTNLTPNWVFVVSL